jgi:decaprenylphospho-beta-D-erythro-pentofuranosid-2-ulose 2-reductase
MAVLKKLLGPPPRDVVLAGRPSGRLWQNAEDLRDLGYHVTTVQYDATLQAGEIDGLLDHLSAHHPVGLAVVAVGSMSTVTFEDGLVVNGLAVALLVHALAQRLTGGQLVLLSSAAAARPRQSIAAYSLGKQLADSAAVMLAPQAAERGVRLLVVRPGFVATRMTEGMRRPPLATTADKVAQRVVRALRGRRVVVWAPSGMASVVWLLDRLPKRLLPAGLR